MRFYELSEQEKTAANLPSGTKAFIRRMPDSFWEDGSERIKTVDRLFEILGDEFPVELTSEKTTVADKISTRRCRLPFLSGEIPEDLAKVLKREDQGYIEVQHSEDGSVSYEMGFYLGEILTEERFAGYYARLLGTGKGEDNQ